MLITTLTFLFPTFAFQDHILGNLVPNLLLNNNKYIFQVEWNLAKGITLTEVYHRGMFSCADYYT